jgi:hypothetical protein
MENFDLRKYLAENKLLKEYLDLEIDEDQVIINSYSGEYSGFIEDDGTVDFSVTGYEEEREDGEIDFDEDNWKDILGPKHAFVKISNQIPTTKVEAAGDYVMITVDLEDLKAISDLAEGKLLKEELNYGDKIEINPNAYPNYEFPYGTTGIIQDIDKADYASDDVVYTVELNHIDPQGDEGKLIYVENPNQIN